MYIQIIFSLVFYLTSLVYSYIFYIDSKHSSGAVLENLPSFGLSLFSNKRKSYCYISFLCDFLIPQFLKTTFVKNG